MEFEEAGQKQGRESVVKKDFLSGHIVYVLDVFSMTTTKQLGNT